MARPRFSRSHCCEFFRTFRLSFLRSWWVYLMTIPVYILCISQWSPQQNSKLGIYPLDIPAFSWWNSWISSIFSPWNLKIWCFNSHFLGFWHHVLGLDPLTPAISPVIYTRLQLHHQLPPFPAGASGLGVAAGSLWRVPWSVVSLGGPVARDVCRKGWTPGKSPGKSPGKYQPLGIFSNISQCSM